MTVRVEIKQQDGDGGPERVFRFELASRMLEAQACGALWDPEARLMVVSDLHLEKGSAYAAGGQMLPPYDTRATLARIASAMARLAPAMVISLGDSFHDRRARLRLAAEDFEAIRSLTRATDWIWITGNHDPAPADDLGGRIKAEATVGSIIYRHEPTERLRIKAGGKPYAEVAGHLHPCARVLGRGRVVRARCFVADGRRLVMPAYGSLTGSLNVCDPAFEVLFPRGYIAAVLGRDSVYAVAPSRLAPEGVARRLSA